MRVKYTALLGLVVVSLTGCRGYGPPIIEEVKPNETAFVVPLDGDNTEQGKLNSLDLLNKQQVSNKRIEIPVRWRQTGYMWFDGQYIPSARLIKVDRSLVTCSWNKKDNTHINVESVESIAFDIEVLANGLIKEEDAPKFLYWYGGKPLNEVMNSNVRADVCDMLAKKFGVLPIDKCRTEKGAILNTVRDDITKAYATRGVTITTLGVNGGLQYDDPAIQQNINTEFISQNKKTIAMNEQTEQAIRNEIKVSMAQAETSAALALASAKEAFRSVRELDIERIKAEKWDGHYPQVLMGGQSNTPLLMQLPAPAVK